MDDSTMTLCVKVVRRASFTVLAMSIVTATLSFSCARGAVTDEAEFSAVRRSRLSFESSALQMALVDVRPPGKAPYVVVTPAADNRSLEHGLAPEAIAGTFRGTPDIVRQHAPKRGDFIPGPLFTNFLQNVIARYAPDVPDYKSLAVEQRDGWLYVVDGRSRSEESVVASRDVLGAFKVRGGVIIVGSYRPNAGYELLTDDGFVTLHEALRSRLMADLLVLNSKVQ